MPTAELPILIVHGDLVPYIAGVAVVVLSVLGLWRRRLREASERTQSFLAELGPITPTANFANGQLATLEGVLRSAQGNLELFGVFADPKSPIHIEPTKLKSSLTREGDADCKLEGPAEVVWGNHLHLEKRRLHMRLAEGDQVRVQGTLQALAAGEGPASYRESASEWQLVGTKERPLQLMTSKAPRPQLGIGSAIGAICVGLTGLTAAGFLLGQCAYWQTQRVDEPPFQTTVQIEGDTIDYPLVMLLTAAMPFHRQRALDVFEDQLRENREAPVAFRALIKLHLQRNKCPEAAQVLLSGNHWDEAIELIHRCKPSLATSQVAFDAHYLRGEFAQAGASMESAQIGFGEPAEPGVWSLPWKTMVQVNLLAGDFVAAAELMEQVTDKALTQFITALSTDEAREQLITELRKDKPTTLWNEDFDARTRSLRCLADATRNIGDPGRQAQTGDSPVCRILQTENEGYLDRAQVLATLAVSAHTLTLRRVSRLLRADGAGERDRYDTWNSQVGIREIANIGSPIDFFSPPQYLGLLARAHRSLSARPEENVRARAGLALALAYWSALAGKDDAAESLAEEVRAQVLSADAQLRAMASAQAPHAAIATNDDERFYELRRNWLTAELVLAALAARAGDAARAHRHLQTAINISDLGERLEYFPEDDVDTCALGKSCTGHGDFTKELLGLAKKNPSYTRAPSAASESSMFGPEEQRLQTKILRGFNVGLPGNLRYDFERLLTLRGDLQEVDAPQWRSEIQSAVDLWFDAFMDSQKSLLLSLLEDL